MKNIYLLLALLLLNCCQPSTDIPSSVLAVQQLTERVLPERHQDFVFEEIESNEDVFEIKSVGNKILIRGNSGVSMARGLNHYLRAYCQSSTWWCGENLNLPEELPLVKKKISVSSVFKYRYIYNQTVNGYSTKYWQWSRWEQEIDWLALQGVNLVLVSTGRESTWYKVLEELGIEESNPEKIKLYEDKIILGQKIINRMKELGISPVLDGYKGYVPESVRAKFEDNVRFCDGGIWQDNPKGPFIHTGDSFFTEFGHKFYSVQKELYGEQMFINADPVVEGSYPDGVKLEDIGFTIQKLILDIYPEAMWVLQGWSGNPKDELMRRTDKSKTIILDLQGERRPSWITRNIYVSTPWIWNIINNFGGNTGMVGNLELIFHQIRDAQSSSKGKTLSGVGTMMEGIENNPAIYTAVNDMAWDNVPSTADEWLEKYVVSRYGSNNPNAQKAWQIFKNTVYNMNALQSGTSENMMCARPGLNVRSVSTWGRSDLYYVPEELLPAWELLIQASDKLKDIDSYQYDCVELTRQVIANYSLVLYKKIIKAYREDDKMQFASDTKAFIELFTDLNSLLATRKEFLVGGWIKQARSWGYTENDKLHYEEEAKTKISTWSPLESYSELGLLHDYGFREWEGIMTDLYKERWELYFTILAQRLEGQEAEDPYWFDFDRKWVTNKKAYISVPQGNSVEVSKELFSKYYSLIKDSY